jgi:hypothetical protein
MALYLNEFSINELKIMQNLVNKDLEHTYEMRKKFGHKNMYEYYTKSINELTVIKVKLDDYITNNERHDRVQEMIDKKFGKKD